MTFRSRTYKSGTFKPHIRSQLPLGCYDKQARETNEWRHIWVENLTHQKL